MARQALDTQDTPRATLSLAPPAVTATIIGVLVATSAFAWWLTADRALEMRGMIDGLASVGGAMPNDMGAGLFLVMWVTMMVAMMLPTIAPMVLAHRMVVRRRNGGALPTVAFVAGYLIVWSAIGVVPLAAFLWFRDLSMDAANERWMSLLAGGVLAGAGAYQFTAWKDACLRACRTPMGFLMTHDFRRGSRGAALAGMSHGAFCLGCCWALMAVLAVVGLMNLAWMGAIALVFLAEKNWRHGAALTKVVGAGLVVLGLIVVISPSLVQRLSI